MSPRALVLAISLSVTGAVHAQSPLVLRMATVAPESSSYARTLQAVALDIAQRTDGAVRIKWYFGSIAGDEPEVAERIRKGQLDGAGSVEHLCAQLSPSMRALLMPGIFRDREEVLQVGRQLEPLFAGEMKRAGYTLLSTTSVGPVVIFSRTPVRSMAQLRKSRMWEWHANETGGRVDAALGIQVVRTAIRDAMRAFDDGRIDGFMSIPGGVLVFQWGALVRYYTDLRVRFHTGCVVVSDRALARLTGAQRAAVRAAFADAKDRFEQVCRDQDEQLFGGLLARRGLQSVPVDAAFRAEFEAAARQARRQLADREVAAALIDRVLALVAELRARSPTTLVR